MARRFAIAFAAGLVISLIMGVVGPFVASHRAGIDRSTAGYTIEVARDGAAGLRVAVADDGRGCEALTSSGRLYAACRLAIQVSPPAIGAAARGKLNFQPTAALEALVWRGRLAGDPGACAAGGLLGDYLARCEAAVGQPTYVATEGSISVTVAAVH